MPKEGMAVRQKEKETEGEIRIKIKDKQEETWEEKYRKGT